MKHFVWAALVLGGCILPVSTGAPLPATTVGRGNVGFALSGEAPTLDLIADQDNKDPANSGAVAYGAAPAAASTLTFSYGLLDQTDLEISGEGALYYFFLPMPTGGSMGIRQHIDAGDAFDLGIAARFGHVGSTATITDSSGNETSSGARANYGALQAIIATKHGFVRPQVALNLMPAHIKRSPSDGQEFSFNGAASSVTFALQLVSSRGVISPYVTATNFYSDRFDNSGWFVSGGILLAVRPDRNAPRIVMPDQTPVVGPPPYGAQPAGPPPPPPPAPTPTAAPM